MNYLKGIRLWLIQVDEERRDTVRMMSEDEYKAYRNNPLIRLRVLTDAVRCWWGVRFF